MNNIKLFYMENCPYCIRVIKFLKENNIVVEMLDIEKDKKNREELLEKGGKVQVPMLLIEGKPLYESLDIIKWFKINIK